MDKIRERIDHLDDQIMKLLEERFKCTKVIGTFKKKNQLPVTNSSREEVVLSKAKKYVYAQEIQALYQLMFNQNKAYQAFTYGLIGKHLPYTLSPYLYQEMGLDGFSVLETDDFYKAIQKIDATGIAITNPYKTEAYQMASKLDESARLTHSVNLIVDRVGYNTDFLALQAMWARMGLDIENLNVVVIGNGATSRSVASFFGSRVRFLVREIRKEGEILLLDYRKVKDCDVLINATPYGTSPNIETKPLFELREFTHLKLVMDVVYNPFRSPLLLEAEKYQIPTKNGLEMLVEQARRNMMLFGQFPQKETNELVFKVLERSLNIVFIGLSFSGKTVLGKKFAEWLGREFLDTDEVLTNRGEDLDSILRSGTVDDFRAKELELVKTLSSLQGKVISTGGGMVLSDEVMTYFKANGLIVYINPGVDELLRRMDTSRPLIPSHEDLVKMVGERKSLYAKYCDLEISGLESLEEIKEKINETIRVEWT